jgi:Lar family restriction alleviation protein
MAELKPCPFCGGSASIHEAMGEDCDLYFFADCDACRVATDGYYSYPDRPSGADLAAEAWNRRAERTCEPVRREGHLFSEGGEAEQEDFSQWLECSDCETALRYEDRYCPGCGARIERGGLT